MESQKIPSTIKKDEPDICPPVLPPPRSPCTWISVAEAAALLHLSTKTVITRIEHGGLIGRIPEDLPFTYDGKPNYVVLLECLPQNKQHQYQISHCAPEKYCQLDLVSNREFYGSLWVDHFMVTAAIIREATEIREKYRASGQVTSKLTQLAEENGMSLATLYRLLGKPAAREASLLYLEASHLSRHLPRTMCLWCAELCIALYLRPDKYYSQNDIFREVNERRGQIPCNQCMHHPANAPEGETVCTEESGFMIVPNNRRTVNRLLSHIPDQVICCRREGVRQWLSKYGYFGVRDKPLLTNDCWQGDHHVFDLFVRVKKYTYKNDHRYEKEVAVRPILTAWMDSATGCIVGWVISILPNADTIAEAFCLGAAFTVGEPFHGLPVSIYTDCGKDYKSNFLEADAPEQYAALPDGNGALNRRFLGLGVLRALNVNICHALPYHPQSKSIERAFRTIEEKYINKLPGWCHNSVSSRPVDFGKKLKKMLENRELLTLEEFVEKFRTEILPAYHGSENTPPVHEDLPGWKLCYESMTPMQRYESMAKARNVTPSWETLGILKLHRKTGCRVSHQGIRFCNTFYRDDSLALHEGETVDILYHAVEKPFAPSSLTVVWDGIFLCEAFPAEKLPLTGASPMDIQANSDSQNAPLKEMKKLVDRIDRSVNAILPDNLRGRSHPDAVVSEKMQFRDEAYGPAVDTARYIRAAPETEQNPVNAAISAAQGIREPSDMEGPIADPTTSTSTDPQGPVISRSEYESCLDFLFGED